MLVALRVWGKLWTSTQVLLFCDNEAVDQVIGSSKTKDPFLAACLRNIWLITASYDIDINIRHIAGVQNNLADALSRWFSPHRIKEKILNHLLNNCKWDKVPHNFFDLALNL